MKKQFNMYRVTREANRYDTVGHGLLVWVSEEEDE